MCTPGTPEDTLETRTRGEGGGREGGRITFFFLSFSLPPLLLFPSSLGRSPKKHPFAASTYEGRDTPRCQASHRLRGTVLAIGGWCPLPSRSSPQSLKRSSPCHPPAAEFGKLSLPLPTTPVPRRRGRERRRHCREAPGRRRTVAPRCSVWEARQGDCRNIMFSFKKLFLSTSPRIHTSNAAGKKTPAAWRRPPMWARGPETKST